MKDTFLKWLAFTLFLGLCTLYSCNEEQWVDYRMGQRKSKHRNEDLTIAKAQQWYEEHYAPVITARSSFTDADNHVKMKPGWDKAKESNRRRYEVVEVPIMTQKPHLLMDAETQKRWNPDVPEKFIRNTAKIVIERDKKTGRTRSFVMIFVGSYDYLKNTHSMGKNSYLYRQPDFDGMVLFYELNGSLVNGWKYTNGKITASIAPKIVLDGEEESTAIKSRGWVEECYTDYIYEPNWTCSENVDVSYDEEYGDYVVTPECWEDGDWVETEVCDGYWEEDDSNYDGDSFVGGSGTSGGNNNSGGNEDNGGNEEDIEPQSCKTLEQVQKYIPERLKQIGIDIGNINILETADCKSYAKAMNGDIYICSQFYNLDIRDQTSVLYHEYYHIKYDKNPNADWDSLLQQLNGVFYYEDAPDSIMDYLRNKYRNEYELYFPDSSITLDEYIEMELCTTSSLPPDFYQNEINAYQNEINNFSDVTDSYNDERQYMYWVNQQKYKIAVSQYKNE